MDASPKSPPGPNVVNQVLLASTLYGCVARCGCGWKAVHGDETAAQASGERHTRTAHGVVAPPTLFDTTTPTTRPEGILHDHHRGSAPVR